MQLLSALGGLTSTLLDISYRWQQHDHWEQVIQKLFNSLPVGLVMVSPGDTQTHLNQWSQRYFREDRGKADSHSGPLQVILQALKKDSGDFHLKIEDTLLFVKIFGVSPEASARPRIALLYDLTRERNRIREALVRECYRCNWKQLPLSVLLIQAPAQEELLQARQPQLEKRSGKVPSPVRWMPKPWLSFFRRCTLSKPKTGCVGIATFSQSWS